MRTCRSSLQDGPPWGSHTATAAVYAASQAVGGFAPLWAIEVFDWWQICKKFHLAQLPCVSVNFQMFNGATPAGFVKDSGETLHVPKGLHVQSLALRCGWNIPLGAEFFLSCPSAVV